MNVIKILVLCMTLGACAVVDNIHDEFNEEMWGDDG